MDRNKELALLYRYQEARRRLSVCEGELADTGRQKTLNDLKNQLRAALAVNERIEKECARLKADNRGLEGECRDYEAQLRELETTLYSGKISAPKELEQLQRRIVEFQKAKAEREEKILNQLYLLEEKEQELALAQKRADGLQRQLRAAEEEEAKRVNTLRAQVEGLKKEVSDAEQVLPEGLKEYYERSAKTLRGVVVIPIKGDTCGFCHMIISPAVMEKVKKGATALLVCENCGRGLFDPK